MIESVEKETFERVWKLVNEISTTQGHFNCLQATYRGMAFAWLLASFLAIGFVMSASLVVDCYLGPIALLILIAGGALSFRLREFGQLRSAGVIAAMCLVLAIFAAFAIRRKTENTVAIEQRLAEAKSRAEMFSSWTLPRPVVDRALVPWSLRNRMLAGIAALR